jgi:hypothetical protein
MTVMINMRKNASTISNECNNDHNLFLYILLKKVKSSGMEVLLVLCIRHTNVTTYVIASLRPFDISLCSGKKGQQQSD